MVNTTALEQAYQLALQKIRRNCDAIGLPPCGQRPPR